ncbi:MAG: hypothetical protein RL748_3327 [Pseudomonadota bacterium]|jgi:triacylglycerol lipase
MDWLLEAAKQKNAADWLWELDPTATGWNKGNALTQANCALLAYANDTTIKSNLSARQFSHITFCTGKVHRADTQAFVGVRENEIVIAFRGTEPTNGTDFATDFNARLIPFEERFPFPGWGSIHQGWGDGVTAVWQQIIEAVNNANLLNPHQKPRIWLTGHSLGGALAVVMAAVLASVSQHAVAGVYTYGQPRVGDPSFVTSYQNKLGNITFRHVNDRDIVPHVPPRELSMAEALPLSPSLAGLADLLTILKTRNDQIMRYEHTGQLHLLLPEGGVSILGRDEIEREPAFLKQRPSADLFLLELGELLFSAGIGVKDHMMVNLVTLDGYIDRIARL